VEPVETTVRVEFAGEIVALSDRAFRVLETASPPTIYIPPENVRRRLVEPSLHRSLCEWKGRAQYWSLRMGTRTAPNAAWSYPSPAAGFEALADYFAFYPGRVDGCFIGEERVQPQPGGFYGGWVTANILGPFKGESGTEGW
jgi:uncharacterized protein (DUF427 family)